MFSSCVVRAWVHLTVQAGTAGAPALRTGVIYSSSLRLCIEKTSLPFQMLLTHPQWRNWKVGAFSCRPRSGRWRWDTCPKPSAALVWDRCSPKLLGPFQAATLIITILHLTPLKRKNRLDVSYRAVRGFFLIHKHLCLLQASSFWFLGLQKYSLQLLQPWEITGSLQILSFSLLPTTSRAATTTLPVTLSVCQGQKNSRQTSSFTSPSASHGHNWRFSRFCF